MDSKLRDKLFEIGVKLHNAKNASSFLASMLGEKLIDVDGSAASGVAYMVEDVLETCINELDELGKKGAV